MYYSYSSWYIIFIYYLHILPSYITFIYYMIHYNYECVCLSCSSESESLGLFGTQKLEGFLKFLDSHKLPHLQIYNINFFPYLCALFIAHMFFLWELTHFPLYFLLQHFLALPFFMLAELPMLRNTASECSPRHTRSWRQPRGYLAYTKIEHERGQNVTKSRPPDGWPNRGKISWKLSIHTLKTYNILISYWTLHGHLQIQLLSYILIK